MGEQPVLWAKLKLGFFAQAEGQEQELLRILQLKRLQSLEYLRLEFRLSATHCPRFLQTVSDNQPAVRKLSLQMDSQSALAEEILVSLAASLIKFEEVDLFFFSEQVDPLAGEILSATLTATAGENSKLKMLTMPGNEKRHAEAIAEARGREVTVKLVRYDRSDDDQDEDDYDYGDDHEYDYDDQDEDYHDPDDVYCDDQDEDDFDY